MFHLKSTSVYILLCAYRPFGKKIVCKTIHYGREHQLFDISSRTLVRNTCDVFPHESPKSGLSSPLCPSSNFTDSEMLQHPGPRKYVIRTIRPPSRRIRTAWGALGARCRAIAGSRKIHKISSHPGARKHEYERTKSSDRASRMFQSVAGKWPVSASRGDSSLQSPKTWRHFGLGGRPPPI